MSERKYIGKIPLKRCRYCHSTENLTVDHKIPVSKGGTDEINNLQCLCRTCNTLKSAMTNGEVHNLFMWCRWVDAQKAINKFNRKHPKMIEQEKSQS